MRRSTALGNRLVMALKRFLPKSIFGRSLLIILLPIIVMQMLVAYFFFNAHWDTVTANLSESVAADVAVAMDLFERDPGLAQGQALDALLRPDMQLSVAFKPNEDLPTARRRNIFSALDKALRRALSNALDQPFWFDTTRYPNHIDIRVQTDGGVVQFYAARDRVFAPTGFVFIFWLLLSTLALSLVSIFYIRRQSVPIRELADAADAFGKGQDEYAYKPHGAAEVRRAGQSFLKMRNRIRRQLEQRTMMLAGVSHDLRTPLTRLKLALSMLDQTDDVKEARADISEMEAMLTAYLDFAEGAGEGHTTLIALDALVSQAAKTFGAEIVELTSVQIEGREAQLQRALSNLLSNAQKYADNCEVALKHDGNDVIIHIDDDGPGISEGEREEALRPFTRLDAARNQNVEGVGLGLAVTRDIVRAHGGRLLLTDSPLGGLRATIVLRR